MNSNQLTLNPTEQFFGFTTGLEARARIQLLAAVLDSLDSKLDIADMPLVHHFAPNQYGREIHLKAGTVIVGKIHKYAQLNVVSQGQCIVATFEGEQLITAPATFVSPAGVQRAVMCISDTVWTTIHTASSQDISKIEQEIIAKDYNDIALPVTIEAETTQQELI